MVTITGTALVGVSGGDGRAGMQWALTLASLTCVVMGVVGAIGGIVDQVRGHAISRRRLGLIIGALAGGLLGVTMLAALAVAGQEAG